MLKFAVFFIFLAALLYTGSIWREKFKKRLSPKIVMAFKTAFCCDLLGTSAMLLMASNRFSLSSHSIGGYFALLIMAFHFFCAKKSIKNPEKYSRLFTKWSVVAWVVWFFAFFSGIPKAQDLFEKIF